VANIRVVIASTTGNRIAVVSNPFGYYEFGGLTPGETYTINVLSKRYTFSPRTVSVSSGLTDIDMIAEP
jgi:hypothetical protein